MTVAEALSLLPTRQRADAETLLAALAGVDRSWLLAHSEDALAEEQARLWTLWVERRKAGEPVSYITQRRAFYGLEFLVDSRVMVPRPATEGLVELALQTLDRPQDRTVDIDQDIVASATVFRPLLKPAAVVDIGTGSGCIALAIASKRPDIRVIATDISQDALDVAESNADRLKLEGKVEFRIGDGLKPLEDITYPFLIVSNPPYVPEDHPLPREVIHYEPQVALFSGSDGTDLLRRLFNDAAAHPSCTGIVLECRKDQTAKLAKRKS